MATLPSTSRAFRFSLLGLICLMMLVFRADPVALNDFTPLPAALASRYSHTATLLQDGRVLIAGGVGSDDLSVPVAEIFDPVALTYSPAGSGFITRKGHTATLLPDGNVLIAGGYDNSGQTLFSTQIYQRALDVFVTGPDLPAARAFHTATPLANGDVLLVGGFDNNSAGVLSSAVIYEWAAGAYVSPLNTLSDARYFHTATALPGDRVLVHGGLGLDNVLATAEIYDHATRTFTAVSSGTIARAAHTATYVLGHVVVAGGASAGMSGASIEVYDPAQDSWTLATSLIDARQYHTATEVNPGTILFAGGKGNTTEYLASAELYDLTTDTVTPAGSLTVGRYFHTATMLQDGTVLINGGFGDNGILTASEQYNPIPLPATTLTIAPVSAVAGQNSTIQARLATDSGTPLENQTVTFTIVGGAQIGAGLTDANGVVSVSWTPVGAFVGSIQVDFAPVTGYLASSASTSLTVVKVSSTLSALNLTGTALVGETVVVSTTLTRATAPQGVVANAPVTFTLTYDAAISGNASPVSVSAITNPSGIASTSFQLEGRGIHTISAAFNGDGSLGGSSRTANLTVNQRTFLLVNVAHGAATDPITVSAVLTAFPGNTPLTPANIDFDFSGVVPSGTAITNTGGLAALTRVFATPNTYSVTASFNGLLDYYVDVDGNLIPTTWTAAVDVAPITTALTEFPVASQVVGESLTVRTVLSRLTAPAGVLSGKTVTFTLDNHLQVQDVTTDADGAAEATFHLDSRGTHTVMASYAGDTALIGSVVTTTFLARQQVQLTAAQTQPGVAGVPTDLTATLFFAPGGPAGGQTISFSMPGGSPNSASATTDPSGVARVSVTYSSSGSFSMSATFAADQGDFLNRNGVHLPESAGAVANVNKATSALSAVTVASGTAFVGEPVTLTTTLSRVTSPGMGPWAGSVEFTVTPTGGGQAQTMTATAGSNGVASAQFIPSARGPFTVTANFAGDSAQNGASASGDVTVYQKTQLTAAIDGPAIAGLATRVTATLVAIPSNTPISDGIVTFSTSVSGQGPTTTAVGTGGVASTSFTFPSAATVSITAIHWPSPGSFLATRTGLLGGNLDLASLSAVSIQGQVATLSPPSLPAHALVAVPMTVSAILTGQTGVPIVGNPISFNVTKPSGAVVVLAANTGTDGSASVTFTPSERGAHTVHAVFGGNAMVPGSASSDATVPVYQPVILTLSAPPAANPGAEVPFTATLTTVPGGVSVPGQSVTLTLVNAQGQLVHQDTLTTGANGVATVNVPLTSGGSYTGHASFLNAAGFYADSTGAFPIVAEIASATVTIEQALTALADLSVPNILYVGDTLSVATVLTRVSTPSGMMPGRPVTFTLTGPAGPLATTVTTLAGGVVSASLPLQARGPHTITASFAGDASHQGTEASASFTVYQKTQIYMPAVQVGGAAGAPIAFSAKLLNLPQGTPLADAPVALVFFDNNGAVYSVTATTDSTGVAAISHAFTSAYAGLNVSASFTNVDGFFANNVGGLVAETGYATINVTLAPTTLTAPGAPATARVGDQFNVSTTLSRTDGLPAGAGHPVTFTLTGPGGETQTVPTDVNGRAQASFTATAPGVHQVSASFSGDSALLAATSSTTSITIAVPNNAPTFTAVAPIVVEADTAIGRVVTFTATGADGEEGTIGAVCSPASGSSFPLGTTTVSCTVTDAAGASDGGSFTVTVRDTTRPSITAPAAASLGTNTGATFVGSIGTATATDIVSSGDDLAITNNAPAIFPLGSTTVTWTATDQAGNATSATQIVTIRDDDAPVITPPPALTVGTNTGATYVGAIGTATVTDNVSSGAGITLTHNAPAVFPVGATTITWQATDQAGNASTATHIVTVVDDDAPVVTVPANITAAATTSAGVAVSFAVTAVDAVDSTTPVNCTRNSGAIFPIGTTTVVCSAADDSGNAASGSFTVTVTEVTVPGEMRGDGFVRDDDAKYRFEFVARERASGERASLSLRIDDDGRRKKDKKKSGRPDRDDQFQGRTVTFVRFSDDPTIRPGHTPRPQIDSVHFGGVGEWNGNGGYRYEVVAQDAGEPGRHRETIRVTVWSPSNAIVASFEGELDGGNIQSVRIRH